MMKRRNKGARTAKLLLPALAAGLAGWLLLGSLRESEAARRERGARQLAEALRRAAVSCYAVEGRYPSDLSRLREEYGVQIDETRYAVFYRVFAENLMPEIAVTGRTG